MDVAWGFARGRGQYRDKQAHHRKGAAIKKKILFFSPDFSELKVSARVARSCTAQKSMHLLWFKESPGLPRAELSGHGAALAAEHDAFCACPHAASVPAE